MRWTVEAPAHSPLIVNQTQADDGQVFPCNVCLPASHDFSFPLPNIDRAIGTRNICVAGLLLSCAISAICLALTLWDFKSGRIFRDLSGEYMHDQPGEHTFFLSITAQELVKLAINICITFCTDCMGYIHATSLRWALWREDRLVYNSNLRLLASTRPCSSNRWSTNLVSLCLLAICYTSSAQLFLSASDTNQANFVLNAVAVGSLGVGILGQAMISSLCLYNSSKLIPSWSSNPINAALVCMHSRDIRHISGRCMLSAFDDGVQLKPRRPQANQLSAKRVRPLIKHVNATIWGLWAAVLAWAGAVISILRRGSSRQLQVFNVLPFYGEDIPVLQFNLCALLITAAFQTWLTMGLHCAELLVNVSRDEDIWRGATSTKGTRSSYGPLGSMRAAVLSWQKMFLFGLNPLTHWLFGIAINQGGGVMYMAWDGILFLALAVTVLCLFSAYIGWRRPGGSQPVTYGHLHTLANLIDDWANGEALWWGDKGEMEDSEAQSSGMRHAGTAGAPLKPVQMDSLYAG